MFTDCLRDFRAYVSAVLPPGTGRRRRSTNGLKGGAMRSIFVDEIDKRELPVASFGSPPGEETLGTDPMASFEGSGVDTSFLLPEVENEIHSLR